MEDIFLLAAGVSVCVVLAVILFVWCSQVKDIDAAGVLFFFASMISIAGILLFGGDPAVNPDTFVLTLPLLGHATWHLYDQVAYGNGPEEAAAMPA